MIDDQVRNNRRLKTNKNIFTNVFRMLNLFDKIFLLTGKLSAVLYSV